MLDLSGLAHRIRRNTVANINPAGRHEQWSLLLELTWHSANAVHTDCTFQQGIALQQDFFPRRPEGALMSKSVGNSLSIDCEPRQLVAQWDDAGLVRLDPAVFKAPAHKNVPVRPAKGRFYPRCLIAGVNGITRHDMTPMRVTAVDRQIEIDLNHPMAGHGVSLTGTIVDTTRHAEPGRTLSCSDLGEQLTQDGPGMQARWRNQPTDFWSAGPFVRDDDSPDKGFYAQPRFVNHVDAMASSIVGEIYRQCIPANAVVLDLMASWDSHLPDSLALARVVGLGLNAQELARNERLDDYAVHDLNENPHLPFDANGFDAAICTVSVEYLTQPMEVFAEVARVLRPGGVFAVTFSNRRFPPKAIRVWEMLHDYERTGLVLEYFLNRGLFAQLRTWSLRGLPRPRDDKYADRLSFSDPVFAVCGARQAASSPTSADLDAAVRVTKPRRVPPL